MFLEFKPVHTVVNDDTVYADIANHCKEWSYYRVNGSKVSSAHEASHGICSYLRNSRISLHTNFRGYTFPLPEEKIKGGKNCFYVLNDRYVEIPEPNIRKRDCIPFIPQRFRKSRYSLYIAGQQAWDDVPLYVFDEWIAYTNGAITAIDLDAKGKYDEGQRDNIYGTIEFIAYGLAICMAAEKVGSLSEELRKFCAFELNRALDCHKRGKGKWPFGEDQIIDDLMNHSDGQIYRDFINKHLDKSLSKEDFNLF